MKVFQTSDKKNHMILRLGRKHKLTKHLMPFQINVGDNFAKYIFVLLSPTSAWNNEFCTSKEIIDFSPK